MSNLSLYLDDGLERRVRESAAREGVSVSKWIARLADERTAQAWPDEVLALAGAWADDDVLRPQHAADAPRVAW